MPNHNYRIYFFDPPRQDQFASYCRICGGSDEIGKHSLTWQCPGEPLTDVQRAALIRGVTNFEHGKWIKTLPNNHKKNLDCGQIID